MLIFREFSRHNLIKIYTRTHQTAPNFENFLRELAYAPEPLSIYVHELVIKKMIIYQIFI